MALSIITLATTDNGVTSRNTINSNFAAILASYPTSAILVGTTDSQTLTNKILTSAILTTPVITWGSDANGDIMIRTSGVYGRLGIGTINQVLTSDGSKPVWGSPSGTNFNYVADTGAANAYVALLSPALASYTAGVLVQFKAANANTTASTLNVNGLGVKTIKKLDGATDLVANDIKAGQIVTVEYDGTNFQMLNPVANAPLLPTGDGSGLTNLPTGKINSTYTDVVIASSTTETTLVTQSITGGILSTNNAIRSRLYFTALNVSGTSNSVTFRLKYGATTLISKALSTNGTFGAATNYSGFIDILLLATGATGTQEGMMMVNFSPNTGIGNAAGTPTGIAASISTSVGTSTEDSTAAKTFAVTAQFSNNGASDNLTMTQGIIEKVS